MTTDITELAQSLKAAAEKASNGEWVKESGDGWEASCSANDQANGGFIIANFEGPDAAENREFVQAANPTNILALVEALEKAQQRNGELETYSKTAIEFREAARDENRHLKLELEIAEKRIAELESRSVTVKLTDINEYLADVHDKTLNRAFRLLAEGVRSGDVAAMRAAGIKVEAE